jgi:nucleotide-binding universal stress UspA family protein
VGDDLLRNYAATLREGPYTVDTECLSGDPAFAILDAATRHDAQMIVIGARGPKAIKRFLLGSVSDWIARHAHCAVLVVKGPRRKLGSVLVGMDGSEDSFRAVRFLRLLALPRQTKVRLLSVVERMRYPTTAPQSVHGQLVAMIKELEAERRAELDKVLERAAAELDDKITRVTRYTPTGDPAEEIVATANDFDADLVVVGARGLGGMARVLLGSVSQKVLHHARCPVLIVKEHPKA